MKISLKQIGKWSLLLIGVAAISSGVTWLVSHNGTKAADANMQQLYKAEEIRAIVQERYYEPVEEKNLYDGAYKGMLWALDDPYSFYYTQEELEETQQRRDGGYKGIGIQVIADTETGYITIVRVFRETPAAQAGLRTGDLILAVEGVEYTAYDMDKAVAEIKGEIDTSVVITVKSGDNIRDVSVKRAEVEMNRVNYHMAADNIGYIEILEFFGDDVTGFSEAMESLKEQGAEGFIIDVRDNPGGYIDHVVPIVDILVPGGRVVYTKDRQGKEESWHSGAEALGMPLAVLVNDMSASAAEILAGAVQDYKVGTVIGETTFGKGIVQTMIPLSDGSAMQLTTSSYFTPNGRSIHGTGIEPDIEVEVTDDFKRNRVFLDAAQDQQLRKAIEVLQSEIETNAVQDAA